MIKNWIQKAIEYLEYSLTPIPHEINEIDWKEELSPNNRKLCKHLSAFANHPGGGFLVFGIKDETAELIGVTQEQAELIMQKLSNLCRDSVFPVVSLDHTIEEYKGVPLLFVYIKESAIKPISLNAKSIEDSYIRIGGTTRQASRQEIGALMLNSKTPHYEELHAGTLKSAIDILDILDYRSVFNLLKKPTPQNQDEIYQ